METLNFSFVSPAAVGQNFGVSAGVVNSGNLEVLIEAQALATVDFVIQTRISGFASTWRAVLADFVAKYPLGGCVLSINDSGATPAVVALRLRQLYELFIGGYQQPAANSRYLELNPHQRILALCDVGSFCEWLGPSSHLSSPHLAELNLAPAFDDGVVIGKASFQGQKIYIAAQNSAFIGGAVGEVNGAKLMGLCLKALQQRPAAVVLLLDSGGVRLHEANAGEIAISEIIAVVIQLRMAKIPVFGVIAGQNGAFGGIGIIAACLDGIVMTENARSGVSGAEVIETVMGVAEYDSSDRALVWRTCGGRHRVLLGDAKYAAKNIASLQVAVAELIASYQPLDRQKLLAEQQRLASRLSECAGYTDGHQIWAQLGYANPLNLTELSDSDFIELLK